MSRAAIRRSRRLLAESCQSRRMGFTLVEMLVSVALVLLIMSLFAQIFQLAAGSITVQQGIAENDQQARMITGLVRGDLDKRSMRLVVPFAGAEDTRTAGAQLDRRQGYFMYAENDPASKVDDILQFTTLVSSRQQVGDESPYSGRADSAFGTSDLLGSSSRLNITGLATTMITVSSSPSTSLVDIGDAVWVTGSLNGANDGVYHVTGISGANLTVAPSVPDITLTGTDRGQMSFVNEPDFDDGFPSNDLGTSTAAEVCYFVRAGTLYRRVLPIRDARSLDEAQPRFRSGNRVISSGTPATGNYPLNGSTTSTFWRDFDYSAFHYTGKTVTASPPTIGSGVIFHASGPSLDNSGNGEFLILDETASPVTSIPVSLGIPQLRFGHNPNTGLPREYLNLNGTANDLTDDTEFLGRFLTQETASTAFGYPGYMPANNPYTRTLTASTGLSHVIDEFEDSPAVRRGDDIILPNVLAFDVQIRDPASGIFVDLGDDTNAGNVSFNAADRLNPQYCQDNSTSATVTQDNRYRFDTWHPQATVGGDNDPPFRPVDGSGNVLPITAVQITIVYQNQVDGRIRQVTIVQSLQDRP